MQDSLRPRSYKFPEQQLSNKASAVLISRAAISGTNDSHHQWLTYSMEQIPNSSSASKEIPRILTKRPSPRSQGHVICSKPIQFTTPKKFLWHPATYNPPIHIKAFLGVSSLHESQPKPCIRHSSPPYVSHSSSNAYFLSRLLR